MAQVEICGVCSGKGYNSCPICRGTGKIKKDLVPITPDTNGIRFVDMMDECKTCQGTGRLLCNVCNGSGRLLNEKSDSTGFRTLR